MPSNKQKRIAAILAIVAERGWRIVDLPAWSALCAALPEVAENTLRHDMRETGLPLHPLLEGVRLDTLESLGRTLLALAECYTAGSTPAQEKHSILARSHVLAARRKAEFILRNPRVAPSIRAAAEEKFLWLRVWLENPPLFSAWLALREETLSNRSDTLAHPSS